MLIEVRETVEACRDRFILLATKEEVTNVIDKIVKRVIKENAIKGFRKGKATPEVVKSLAKDTIINEAKQILFRKAYEEALFETKYTAFGEPQITKINATLTYFKCEFTLAYNPVFELGKHSGFQLHEPTGLPTSEEVREASIKEVCKNRPHLATFQENEVVMDGDVIIVNYTSTIDGEPFENSVGNAITIEVGNKRFNRDFEMNVMGMKINDTREFDIVFDKNASNKNIAGKTIHFIVTIMGGIKKTPSEYNEELAKQYGCETLEALNNQIDTYVVAQIEKARRNALKKEIFDLLLESNTIEVPEWMQEQSAKFLSYTKGIKWEDNSDEVKSFLMKDALFTLKLTMIFNKIRQAEKETELTQEEIQTVLMQNMKSLPEEMQKAILDKDDPKHMQYLTQLYSEIQDEQVIEWIIKHSTIGAAETPVTNNVAE